jgi:SAM-dependent methyltransferase
VRSAAGDHRSRPRDLTAYAVDYADSPFEDVQSAVRRRLVLERVAVRAPSTLLEVGCGLVPLAMHLPSTVSSTVVEPAPAFAAAARSACRERDAVVETTLESAVSDGLLGTPPSFDVVVLSSLLHEVDDPAALLAAVRACCGPTTTVHVNVPHRGSLHRLLGRAAGLTTDLSEPSARQVALQQREFYGGEDLHHELEAAGFTVVSSGGILLKPFSAPQMLACRESGVVDDRVLAGLEELGRTMPELASEIWCDAVVR